MIPISREISDLKAEFEGGKSFSVDWYVLMRKAAENVLDNLNPETTKRTVPIYGGLTRGLQVYYCPSDVQVPSRLYSYDRTIYFDYMPPAAFYARQNFVSNCRSKFTIEYVNGVRFIVVYNAYGNGRILTLDEMNDTDGLTGVTMSLNSYNVLPGSTASLQGTFTDTAYTIGRVFDSSINITDFLRGVAVVPMFVDSAEDIESVELSLYATDTDYYTLSSTQDTIGDNVIDGQNMVRFWMNNAARTGTPNPAAIVRYELRAKMKTGESQTVIFGKLTLQLSALFFLDYYSRYVFVNPTTGAWSDTPAIGYNINLNRDALGILHYEAAVLTIQAAGYNKVDAQERQAFVEQLARKYKNYYLSHPSSEQPLSYSILPDIPYNPYIFGVGPDIGEHVGENLAAENDGSGTSFNYSDNELPSGAINGTNTVFALAFTPYPAGSLQLFLNGQYQTQGVDYTLAGSTITFSIAPADELDGMLRASYRYAL